ncbi:D-glycerate dehydrogenase (plasmid) [Pseudorhodobacter turbinis]|uniref:D-glycerate dehydrogenase n=1 Tax=Pseudorhodobacter turbinis TaxID=2500533 RepID=A0A4P8EL61_9RHOB|nr:D-glycerate dehydrogenase [Pseudorhodobacter turbinis]QCO58010.1 D-glycerate dehydrogenase [Pseudorhodobacter turbinis]
MPGKVVAEALRYFSLTIREDVTPMTHQACVDSLHQYDAVLATLGDPYNAQVFDENHAPRCRLLANFGVGYNHIDVAAAKRAGVVVTNTPGAVTDATADIALTLMLMTARRAGEAERMVRAGLWEGWHPTQLLGAHMSGKSIGVIGMGRIGKAIAKRAHYGFGMQVRFFNRSPVANPGMPSEQVDMEEALAADFVVIAVPGGPETRHLINAEALSQMKPHAFLINIARGDIVDEAALIDALQNEVIAGAGLDVYEHEPVVAPALMLMENVTLLPHLGTAALEVREAMGLMAVENLHAFFEGKPLPNQV